MTDPKSGAKHDAVDFEQTREMTYRLFRTKALGSNPRPR